MAIRLANGDVMDAEGNFDEFVLEDSKADNSMRMTSATANTFE